MNYIGVDCHISTLDFAVVTETGRVKNNAGVKISIKEFMEFIKAVPKPRKIFIEGGTWANWLLETSMRYENNWINCMKQRRPFKKVLEPRANSILR